MKNDDKPGFRRAQRFVKRDAHQYNSQREHQKRLKAKRHENALLIISEFLKCVDNVPDGGPNFDDVAVMARNMGFDILKEKDNG